MSVKVIANQSTVPSSTDFVRVRTQTDPNDDTVTLATIERVVAKARPKAGSEPWYVRTLIQEQPMGESLALGLATRYAERKNIDTVYRVSS